MRLSFKGAPLSDEEEERQAGAAEACIVSSKKECSLKRSTSEPSFPQFLCEGVYLVYLLMTCTNIVCKCHTLHQRVSQCFEAVSMCTICSVAQFV